MPSLGRALVEHRLLTKAGFKPNKHPTRQFNHIMYFQIKEEIFGKKSEYALILEILIKLHLKMSILCL